MKFSILNSEFSFNSYVYYITRGFIPSTLAFNLLNRAFNLATRAFSLLTRGSERVTCGFELATPEFELVTHNSCFTFPRGVWLNRLGNCFCMQMVCSLNPPVVAGICDLN